MKKDKLPSVDEAGVIAVNVASNVKPKLTVQEEAFFIAGFQECIKYLMLADHYKETRPLYTVEFEPNSVHGPISKEKMAEILNERIYGDEITKEEEKLAKDNGLVVVFGASDDLIEMRGAIDDEFGKEVFLTRNGEIEHCDDDCKHYERAVEKAKKIKGIFGKNGWTFETDIPCAEFDIFEDGQLYGKGLVFYIESLD